MLLFASVQCSGHTISVNGEPLILTKESYIQISTCSNNATMVQLQVCQAF